MGTSRKLVVHFCIISILFMGCSGSVLIDPTGPDRDKIYSKDITQVITSDSTKYTFDVPPVIVNDSIVGGVKVPVAGGMMIKHVTIPISEVAEVSVSEVDTMATVLGIIATVLTVVVIAAADFSFNPSH